MFRGHGFRRRMLHEQEKASFKEIKKEDYSFILKYVKRHKRHVLISLVITLLLSVGDILAPLVSKVLVDDFILAVDIEGIIIISSLLMGWYCARWLLSYVQGVSSAKGAQGVVRDLRKDVYTRILHQSMQFNTERRKGMLLSLVTNDVDALSNAFTSGFVNLVKDVLSLGGVLVTMLVLDIPMALVTLAVMPAFLIILRVLGGRIKKAFLEVRRKIAVLSASVEESITGMRVVTALNAHERKVLDFNELSQDNFTTSMKATLLFAILFALISINSFVAISLVIGVGSIRYVQGAITLGTIIAFFQIVAMLIQPVRGLVQIYNVFQEAAASLQHISEYMGTPVDVPEPDEPISLPEQVMGRIELRGVRFGYGRSKQRSTDFPGATKSRKNRAKQKDVEIKNDAAGVFGIDIEDRPDFIVDMNLVIEPGEKVGLVGETGAGKSTFVNLITRLYDVKAGAVLIDGIDVRRFRQKELRSLFSVVSQNVVLFSDTIMNNIRFGRPSAGDEEVIEAAKMASSHDFIMKQPHGYDTHLGERGTGLSGGQKQLIAYARMILARPKIAILDEATSNIDSYTECLIQANMENVLSGRTSVVIAHRFATLKTVDRLIMLERGAIIDDGTHEELYQRNAQYKELVDKQYSKL